jgi:hypothetical protein
MREFIGSKEGYEEQLMETEVWAYTIRGNKEADHIWSDFMDIILKKLSLEESYRPSDDFLAEVINTRAFKDLLNYVESKKSRLPYLIFGVLLMQFGAKMPSELKKPVLEYSCWEYEEHQFIAEKDKQERKKYLLDFRERIKNYRDGIATNIPVVYLSDLIEQKFRDGDFTLLERQKIDYSL